MRPHQHYADLRHSGGKQSIRLTTQTDQLWEGLTHFGEWLVFGEHANPP